MPIFIKGTKRDLNGDDLYQPLKEHKSERIGQKLCQAWEKELEKHSKSPSLLRAVMKVFGWKIMLTGLILASLEFFFR